MHRALSSLPCTAVAWLDCLPSQQAIYVLAHVVCGVPVECCLQAVQQAQQALQAAESSEQQHGSRVAPMVALIALLLSARCGGRVLGGAQTTKRSVCMRLGAVSSCLEYLLTPADAARHDCDCHPEACVARHRCCSVCAGSSLQTRW